MSDIEAVYIKIITTYLIAADIHTLLPIKNNRIVAASNKSSLGECTYKIIMYNWQKCLSSVSSYNKLFVER